MNHGKRHLLGWLFASLALAGSASAQATDNTPALTTVGQAGAAYRAPGVPDNYVITPGGYFDPACVQHIAPGEALQGDGQVRQANGRMRQVAPCTRPHFTRDGVALAPGEGAEQSPVRVRSLAKAAGTPTAQPDIAHAYVESATWVASNNQMRRMTADWVVPTNPSVVSNGVVFFFPGLEDLSNVRSILQPVLGYNAYSSNGVANHIWTIASWNCCIAGNVFSSDAVQTYPGNRIHGEMVMDCPVGTNCQRWTVTTTDQTMGNTTTLANTDTIDQEFDWVFGVAMEVYGITNCRQYPRDGSMTVSNIQLWDLNNTPVTPSWSGTGSTTSLQPSCLYHVDATRADAITISY
ncbi:hypothetical protein L2Y96_07285 [Luteibacter aegosomaticola]|uniref:hypothetical protein n=1 Tax=Luteibacter aegosomaticola TaxID=2911538 RepID=UPI001FF95E5E|nr:hypothetical protein [Luteibacter aegosomaticola]UPG91565.1 hypothetical protein L2Y96_07285 [Luteibacter aegosomaticola]